MKSSIVLPEARELELLGIRIHPLTMSEAAARIVAQAQDPESQAVYVVKPYVEFFTRATAADREILNRAWLSLPDGVALQWAGSYLDPQRNQKLLPSLLDIMRRPQSIANPIPERFAGATFTRELLQQCAGNQLRIALIGSPKHQPISATAAYLRQAIPGLEIVLALPSPAPGKSITALAEEIGRAKADVILVGMGYPRQERLMAALAPKLGHGVLIGEGGTFDYREFGGKIARAPLRVRQSGLEWLWRLVLEPSRIRRQMAIPRFVWQTHKERRRQRG